MATFDPIILDGDRVALAPHLDLWMSGYRFGTVTAHSTFGAGPIHHRYYVLTDDGFVHPLDSDDLLGAVR